jgi:nitrite reductase (cytochrome c-552)
MKISDHHVRSPLLNINNACQTCHKVPEEELLARAENIQMKHVEMRDMAMDALVELIDALVAAKEKGMPESKLDAARDFHRKASFLIDFVEAENSAGFHAPQEAARIMFQAMDYMRQGIAVLAASPIMAQEPAPEPSETIDENPI